MAEPEELFNYQALQDRAAQLLTRKRKARPDWISYLIMGAFYIKFSMVTHFLLFSCEPQPASLLIYPSHYREKRVQR